MKFLRLFLFSIFVSLFSAGASVSVSAAEAVNINTADAVSLAKNLNGVGLKKAKAIIAYRDKHGSFKSAQELAKVKGIGNKTILKNKDYIRVGKNSQ
jgi:competence protein ComEA